jgi:hypothetical protein
MNILQLLSAFFKDVLNLIALLFIGLWRLFKKLVLAVGRWLMGVCWGLLGLWRSLGPRWLRVSLLVVAVGILVYWLAQKYLAANLTQENIYRVQYLNDGWTQDQRQTFYFTPQGTELLGLEYQWFINLELPLSVELLATEGNLRGWGFIVDPAQRATPQNPGNLAVGMGRHTDPLTGKQRLDMGCAMCHTGELHYQGTALRVDGGQSLQSISSAQRGEFITTLGASVFETLLNPFKWDRFATRILGHDDEGRSVLKKELWAYADKLKAFNAGAGASKYYPVVEGRGRTDAVGRIANIVFGFDLDEPANYRIADAPASYPFIWDIWRFDWVQYTGFTNQAMARNVGESLGVLAPIKLVDDNGNLLPADKFGETIVDVDGMHCVEGVLRDLKPPKWPENVLGKIDIQKARQGKDLFAEQCSFCHGPHISEPYEWPVATGPGQDPANQVAVNWQWDMQGDITEFEGKAVRKDWREKVWALPWIDIAVIGTDPKLADNYINNTYSATKLVPGAKPVNAGDGLQVLLNRLVPILYQQWDVDASEVANFDGLNVPFRITNQHAYKSRPLHGVWATPPFLHNGSVPSIYDLLSPLRARPTEFYVGNREYDPIKLGYITSKTNGSFLHDTRIAGNQNIGHLFTDVDMPGRIGDLFSENERMALIEYIKVMGDPEFDQVLGGDPLNWDNYTAAPEDLEVTQSCQRSHELHVKGLWNKAAAKGHAEGGEIESITHH